MSSESQLILCRRCKETIPAEDGSCPHCGAGIRNDLSYYAISIFGLALIGASALRPNQLYAFGVLGGLLVVGAVFFLYDKRQRIQQASEGTV